MYNIATGLLCHATDMSDANASITKPPNVSDTDGCTAQQTILNIELIFVTKQRVEWVFKRLSNLVAADG